MAGIAFVIKLSALTALVLGAANLVGSFPWVAVLIGLLWTLYVRHKD
jgi:hypothetical protein